MLHRPSRRVLLASGLTVAIAGCTDEGGSSGSGSPTTSSPSAPAERRPADAVGRAPDGVLACWQLAVSDDGSRVAATTPAGVTIWTIADGTHVRDIPAKGSGVVAWSPDGRHLAASSDDTDIVLLDVAKGASTQTFTGHGPAEVGIAVTGLAFSPDGATLVSTGEDGTVRRWSVDGSGTPEEVRTAEKDPQAVAFSPDGRQLAVVGLEAPAQVSDASGAKARAAGGEPARGCALAWSPDGSQLAVGTEDSGGQGFVVIHDARTLEEKASTSGDLRANAVSFSPDGTQLAIADNRITADVVIWDIASSETTDLAGHESPPATVAWVDETTVVSASDADGLIVWDPTTGEELRRMQP